MNEQEEIYEPFNRGPFPVGVLSQDLEDPGRKRTLPTEIWYPATDEYLRQDLAEETKDTFEVMGISGTQKAVRDAKLRNGSFPLIIYSHGHGGHRRLSAHLCTHLASHGYVVASSDHIGNTVNDMLSFADMTEQEVFNIGAQVFVNRPKDVTFLIDCMLENKSAIPSMAIEEERIGVTGYSYGGWTILMATSNDQRISVALPIASGGGTLPDPNEPNPARDVLNLDWKREIPTLYIACEKDTLVPLSSIYDLYSRTQEPKKLVILKNADHFHFSIEMEAVYELMHQQAEVWFGDTPATKYIKENLIQYSQSCPAEKADAFLCALGLVHMDTHLKNNVNAEKWLKGDIEAYMSEKGIGVSIPNPSEIVV